MHGVILRRGDGDADRVQTTAEADPLGIAIGRDDHGRRGLFFLRLGLRPQRWNRTGRGHPHDHAPPVRSLGHALCFSSVHLTDRLRGPILLLPSLLQLRRKLLSRGPGDGRRLDLPARHLPGELHRAPRSFARDEHLCRFPLPGQRHIAGRRPPVVRVIEVCLVQRAALALVDRPGVAVPEPVELCRRPHHLAALLPRRGVQPRPYGAHLCVDRDDGTDVVIVNPRRAIFWFSQSKPHQISSDSGMR